MSDQPKPAEPKDSRIEAALRDYLERVDRGEPVDREEFVARHALIADQLRSFIAAEDEVRKLAGAETPLEREHGSTKSFAGHGQETIAPQSVGKRAVEAETEVTGRFGRYRIIRALGRGAMGAVYLAEDTQLERSVAIKTPHFTESLTEESLERFYREARVAATLRQPNICPVFDVGQIDGKHYISMAYIDGRPLSAFIQPDKPQSERQILNVIRKLALALQEAHEHGIVHRDLKPANIMVDKKGEPIVMDFGLAQQARRSEDVRLTQTGNILGTPAYMSPEQVEGELDKIGPSTDQYSLGVILYELLTGQLPFRGSVIAVMGQILTKDVTPPSESRRDLDPRIEAVCLKMMAKTPSERFASLKRVADEFAAILKSPAAKVASKENLPGPSQASDRMRADVGESQVLKSLKPKALTESDLASLEELARKCYSRRDFEQVIQIIERIPEEERNTGLVALLDKARGRTDEIAFVICEIDEADRLNDRQTALKKAEDLLKIKPGHHRAREIQEKFAGHGEGGAARIGALHQLTQPWNEGGWIPLSVLVFGLAVFGVMTGIVVIYLGRTAVVIDIKDPGVEVAVKGTTLTITGPDKQSVKVVPGDQELTVSCGGFETVTKSFTIKKGETKAVTVSIVNKEIVARLENEIVPLTSTHEEKRSNPTASDKSPLLPPSPTLRVGQRGESHLADAAKQADAATVKPSAPQLLVAPFDEATAKNAQQAWAVRLKTSVERTNSIGMKLSLIPPGTFTMGSPKEEKGRGKNEDPVRVTLTKAYWLGRNEVTQSEWRRVMQTTPWIGQINSEDGDDYPATYVDWADATEFCTKMTEIERRAGLLQPGSKYMLPTEAQWEYACRAGTTTRYSFGDDEEDLPTHGWFKENAIDVGQRYPHRIGQKRTNAWGLFDMHGNVWEWCRDVYREKLLGGTDPEVSYGSPVRVNRSGCWGNPAGSCRSASRYGRERSERRRDSLGFRIACSSGE